MVPSVLYKYRDDSSNTGAIFSARKVWLATADQLNDPLECKTGVIPEDWKQKTILEMEAGQLMGLVGFPKPDETLFSLDQRKTKLWFRKLKKLSHDEQMREMRALYKKHDIQLSEPKNIFESLQSQLSTVGIFSLTSAANNDAMWAHYAGNHTGLVLGFSANPNNRLGNSRHTLPVTYAIDKPAFKTGFLQEVRMIRDPNGQLRSEAGFAFHDPVFRASISTKPPIWSYEQEWRYVEETSGLHEFPGELISVVFGCRMPEGHRDHYIKLIEGLNTHIDVSEVRITSEGSLQLKSL
jgi:hypothetical protein